MPKQEVSREQLQKFLQEEFQNAQLYAQGQRWEELTAANFPLLHETMPKILSQLRLSAIANEMKALQESVATSTQSPEIIGRVRGAAKKLREATDATLMDMYGDVTPEPMTPGPVEFTRDDAAWIELVKETGAVDLLHPDVIPSLANLNEHQIRQMKLEALGISYTKWETLSKFNTDTQTDTGLLVGAHENPLRSYAQDMMKNITTQMVALASEGMAALPQSPAAPQPIPAA